MPHPDEQPLLTLDVRYTKCPLNFVKARLALEKLAPGQILAVQILAGSDSAINIPTSMTQEGHSIAHTETDPDTGTQTVWVRRKYQ